MKQIYTGKIESATFSNPPENSLIEFLWRDEDQLVANEIAINFSDPEFLAFIEEYPLEKIEKAAKAASRARTIAKEKYNRKIIEEFLVDQKASQPEYNLFDYIDKNNKDKDIIFNCKLKILDQIQITDAAVIKARLGIASNKKEDISYQQAIRYDKEFSMIIRKCRSLKELLGLYYGKI